MALSARAAVILEQMEPGLSYEAKELRTFVPDLTMEHLQDLMRELWVARQVERVGSSGWRRERSVSPGVHHGPDPAAVRPRLVKPEELFDHAAFEDLFK